MHSSTKPVWKIFGYELVKAKTKHHKQTNKVKKLMVGNYMLEIPGNHPMIGIYKDDAGAKNQLGRLTALIAEKYPSVSIIDAGANIGDSIVKIKTAAEVPIISIEGDDFLFDLLKRNTMSLKNVTLIKTYLGEKIESKKAALLHHGWNTTIIPSEEGNTTIHFKTVDEVLAEEHLQNRMLKLLKINCEGFDTIVMRGAVKLIREKKPVIYFEYNRNKMEQIGEDGLSTLIALGAAGYHFITFFDQNGRFIMNMPFEQENLITAMHRYADTANSCIEYYYVCLFHEDDSDLSEKFIASENSLPVI